MRSQEFDAYYPAGLEGRCGERKDARGVGVVELFERVGGRPDVSYCGFYDCFCVSVFRFQSQSRDFFESRV